MHIAQYGLLRAPMCVIYLFAYHCGGFGKRLELFCVIRRIIRLCFWAMICIGMFSGLCYASPSGSHELNYVKAYDTEAEGKEVYRVEIGISKAGVGYKLNNKSYQPNTLVLDMEDTIPGRVRHEVSLTSLATKVKAQEVELGKTRLQIEFKSPIEEMDYKIYTLEADRKNRKPFRLVIDVSKEKKKSARSTEGVKNRHIVLDAGHGGTDSGAVGPTGYMEKEATLAVTQKVRDILENSGAKVTMTRDSDVDVYGPNATDRQELQARVNASYRDPEAEVFVSIHCNAFSNPAAHGTETYYYYGSQQGLRLATLLDEELIKAGGLFDRGVKDANFYVMRHSAIPASLIELAFITNYEEERLLADEAFQNDMANAIAIALGRFFTER